MKRLLAVIILLSCSMAFADGWPWLPNSDGSIRPVADKPLASIPNEYDATAGETIPDSVMMGGTIVNTGATGTEEYTLAAPTGNRVFWVEAQVAQTIEIDFPAGANPYLQGTQIGANFEIDVSAGAKLKIEYRASDATWRCYLDRGLSISGGADD